MDNLTKTFYVKVNGCGLWQTYRRTESFVDTSEKNSQSRHICAEYAKNSRKIAVKTYKPTSQRHDIVVRNAYGTVV